jgi:serine/threonine protein kinase
MQRGNWPPALSSDGRYRITRLLGTGGLGVVYEATDIRRGRPVALKFLKQDQPNRRRALKKLEHEATAMLLAAHPRVCAVYGLDEYLDRPCLVMERLAGRTLDAHLRNRSIETADVIRIGAQIADGLAAVHRAGLVHRDLKPANVFVTTGGAVKLLDFGLAMWQGLPQRDLASGHVAINASVHGTTNYIAPERILQRPIDSRSDLFSLGALLYEMTTGRQPFAGSSPAETLFNVLDREPAAIRDSGSSRSPAVEHLILRLLAKPPERRYQSAAAVRRALVGITAGTASSVRHPSVHRSFFPGGNHAQNHCLRQRQPQRHAADRSA